MKTFRNLVIICFSLSFLGSQCRKDMDCRANLINNTNDSLVYFFYPEPVGNCDCNGVCLIEVLLPRSSKEICHNETWEHRFSRYGTDRINIIVVSPDSLRKYTEDKVIIQKKYYKLITVSLKELENMNWRIVCP